MQLAMKRTNWEVQNMFTSKEKHSVGCHEHISSALWVAMNTLAGIRSMPCKALTGRVMSISMKWRDWLFRQMELGSYIVFVIRTEWCMHRPKLGYGSPRLLSLVMGALVFCMAATFISQLVTTHRNTLSFVSNLTVVPIRLFALQVDFCWMSN